MIQVEHLSKNYGTASILRDVNFRARAGQITILTGDNGAGKTTLLRVIAGLARSNSGNVTVAGHDIGKERLLAQANLAFLPQNLTFHPAMTAKLLVRFYARLRGRKLPREEEATLLERVDLFADRGKPVKHLSGGMVQRLGLALLFLPDAPVLVLDEPAISLDPGWRQKLGDMLREERDRGKTVLLTTHLPAEWEGEADLHLSCRDGQVHSNPGSGGSSQSGGATGREGVFFRL